MATIDGKKTGGRKKGSKNKITRDLKEMVLGALDKAGGQEYLVAQAEKNPTAFLTLIGKILPMQIGGDAGNPIKHELSEVSLRALDEICNQINSK